MIRRTGEGTRKAEMIPCLSDVSLVRFSRPSGTPQECPVPHLENFRTRLECQGATMVGFQRRTVLIMAMTMVNGFRIHAVSATLFRIAGRHEALVQGPDRRVPAACHKLDHVQRGTDSRPGAPRGALTAMGTTVAAEGSNPTAGCSELGVPSVLWASKSHSPWSQFDIYASQRARTLGSWPTSARLFSLQYGSRKTLISNCSSPCWPASDRL